MVIEAKARSTCCSLTICDKPPIGYKPGFSLVLLGLLARKTAEEFSRFILEPPEKRLVCDGLWPPQTLGRSEVELRRLEFFLEVLSMNREDFDILAELEETLTQLEQRSGFRPRRRVTSSSISRRITEFTRKCKLGELKGRIRKRKAHNLLIEILRGLEEGE